MQRPAPGVSLTGYSNAPTSYIREVRNDTPEAARHQRVVAYAYVREGFASSVG
jgi:hypothetical protein